MLFLRLGGESRNKCGAQSDLRNLTAKFCDERKIVRTRPPPPHQLKDPVLAVLKRNIEIFDDLRIVAHLGDELVRDHFGITV